MKKSVYFATQGIPWLCNLLVPVFLLLAFNMGWIHGAIGMIFSIMLFCISSWALVYGEYLDVKEKMSKGLFAFFMGSVFLFCFGITKLFAIYQATGEQASFLYYVALFVELHIAGHFYNKALHKDKHISKD